MPVFLHNFLSGASILVNVCMLVGGCVMGDNRELIVFSETVSHYLVKIQWAQCVAFYFIPSIEFNAYLKQIKVILSAVKKCSIFKNVVFFH